MALQVGVLVDRTVGRYMVAATNLDRTDQLCGNAAMAPFNQHVFVSLYTAALVGTLGALWFRPNVTDLPAWVQAIGSIVAILAAIWIAQSQASRERRKEDELRARRERAAKAVTPLALTQICAWAQQTMGNWREAERRLSADAFGRTFGDGMGEAGVPDPEELRFSRVPDEPIRDIQAMIEVCSEERARPYIALLQALQVQQTRANGYLADLKSPGGPMSDEYCFQQVIETAEIYARASELFDDARDSEAEAKHPVTRPQIRTALFLAGAYEDSNPDLARIADRKYGPSPNV